MATRIRTAQDTNEFNADVAALRKAGFSAKMADFWAGSAGASGTRDRRAGRETVIDLRAKA